MKVRIKRIDKELPLPLYKTEGSVGFDLVTRETTVVGPGELKRIPCNIVVETPPGYMLLLAARSSMPAKKPGLIKPHSIGVVDQDYRGDNDEILFQVQNIGNETVIVERGESIGQGVFVRIDVAEFEEVGSMTASDRGGFGSTDGK